jgi:steroid delta-isomerase-like uncharacterized protein
MSEGNTQLLRDLAEAFNAREFDRAQEFLADDVKFEDLAAGVATESAEGFVQYAQAWAGAFSNMTLELENVVAGETSAAGEFVGRGTHDGTLPMPTGDVPATGRSIEVPFVWYADIAGGKITGLRDYYNPMAMMTQLGLMPEPAETTA